MLRSARVLAVFLIVLAVARLSWAQDVTVTVLHTSDSHSHLDAFGPRDAGLQAHRGGIARLAAVVGMTRAAEPNTLVLDSGDAFHGTLEFNATFGVAQFQLMRQIGVDAMAVGNHEFDFGPDVLAYALFEAFGAETLPLLSANLDLSAKPELAAWIQPSVIKEVGGVKIGIFGMTVPGNPLSQPDPVVILGGDDPQVLLGIAGAQAAALRAAGAQAVIMLSHLGILYDEAVAANVPGIDFILGGHDHLLFDAPHAVDNPAGGQTLIFRAGKFYGHVGKIRFTVQPGGVAFNDYSVIPLDETVPQVTEVQDPVEAVKAMVVEAYGDVYWTSLATAAHDIPDFYDPARRERDTAMGNLITDALRDRTGTVIAFTANGLISEGLYEGPQVGADIFRPVSYGYDEATGLGFKIVTFEITGAELLKALEATLAYVGIDEDFCLQVSGMRFRYDPRQPEGARVIRGSVRIGERRLDPNRKYTATVNEGVAMLIPLMGVQVENLQPRPDLEYNVLKDYVVGKGIILHRPEGRILDVSVSTPGDGSSHCAASVGRAGQPAAVLAALLLLAGISAASTVLRRRKQDLG